MLSQLKGSPDPPDAHHFGVTGDSRRGTGDDDDPLGMHQDGETSG